MAAFAEWFWRTHRSHFVLSLTVLAALLTPVSQVLPQVLLLGAFCETTLTENLIWGSVAVGCVIAALIGSVASLGAPRHTLDAWARGDRSDPQASWNAALRVTTMAATRACGIAFCLHLAITLPVLARYAHPSVIGVIALVLAVAMQVSFGGVFVSIGLTLLFRPLLMEVHPFLPAGATPERREWGLGTRLLLGAGCACSLAGTAGGAAVVLSASRDGRFLAVVLVSILVAGYIALLFKFGLVMPTLEPLADLALAADRVRRGDYSTRVPITSADELSDLVAGFNQMQVGLREREELHAAFGSYVDPVLAQRLLESGSSVFEGEEVEVTVMFADVRAFTAYSEGVSPAEAVQLLNRLFDVVVPALHEHEDHANHYLGDGLLAVFGAPQQLEQHADAAVAAAIEIQRRVRTEFGHDLRVGIGINTGLVIAGTVGGGGRHEFTVIGDTVNVAARVEQLTKDTGDWILITEATRVGMSRPRPRTTKRGEFEVRGKTTKLSLHAINPFPRPSR